MNNLPNLAQVIVNTINNLIAQFQDFIPKLINVIVILTIGYFIAKLLALATKKVLGKIGFDKIGDKLNEIDIVKQLKTEIKLSEIVAKVLFFFVMLIFIIAATEMLGVAAITSMVMMLVNFIPKLVAAAIMLQIGVLIADALKKTVVTICKSFNVPSGKLIGNVVFYFFLIITVVSALGQAGINTELLESTFNLLIGGVIFAFAVGYGFASRDILSNLLSSFYSGNRYKEGQVVQIDGVKGEIVSIDSTAITLKTEKSVVVLPLKILQSNKVELFN
jgi:Conserved TM helix/Mechanosensitive ion channel